MISQTINRRAYAPAISLCMIVKDEEQVLEQSLASVHDLVDEIILVDTGSTDDTMEIGRVYGAHILTVSWNNDFSEARNVSLRAASMDWILVLDADELISSKDHALLRRIISDKKFSGYSLEQRTYGNNPNFINWIRTTGEYEEEKGYPGYVCSPLIRLFRNDTRIVFTGQVHELVEPSFASHQLPYLKTSIPIHHYGKVRDPGRIQDKAMLYEHIGKEKVRLSSKDPKAHAELGAQYVELRDYDKAVESFRKCIEMQPADPNHYVNLGVALLRQRELAKAERILAKAVVLSPQNTEALFNLGAVFLHQARYGEAEKYFAKVIDIKSDHGLAFGGQGMVFLSSQRIEEAIPYLFKAANLNSGDADVYSNLAWAYDQLSWPQQALEFCRRALELSPKHESALNIQKQALSMARFRPDHAVAEKLNKKGEVLFEQGKVEAARICFQEASKLDPFHNDAWNNLGVLFWDEQVYEKSLACFLRAFLLSPIDQDVNDNLILSCRKLGREKLWPLLEEIKENENRFLPKKDPIH